MSVLKRSALKMAPLDKAIELYSSLIHELSVDFARQHIGAIGDPCFEGVRLYSFDQLNGSFDFDQATEHGESSVDQIEDYLLAADQGYSLFSPILLQLKSVSAQLNQRGVTVFFGAWGMGPGEIGWAIRYLNERHLFIRYLADSGITEADVDLYNDAFIAEIN